MYKRQVLNRRWGRNYQAWEEIEPPRCAATFNDMVDWREFFGETLAEELHMRAKAVRLHDGEHSVMVHTVPMPYFNFMNTGSEDVYKRQAYPKWAGIFPPTVCMAG